MIKKLNKELKYNSGIFNNKNEKLLAKAVNMLFEKVDELTDEINRLKKIANER